MLRYISDCAGVSVQLQRDVKIDKLASDVYIEQSLEILAALRKLGETLRPEEDAFLASHSTTESLRLFEKVDHHEQQQQLGEWSKQVAKVPGSFDK